MTDNEIAILERVAHDLDELAAERSGEVVMQLREYAGQIRKLLRHDVPVRPRTDLRRVRFRDARRSRP